jgi:hypothetical protein
MRPLGERVRKVSAMAEPTMTTSPAMVGGEVI